MKTRRRLWRAGGAKGAGYGERAEFVYDGAKVGVSSAQVKNAPLALEGWRREGGAGYGERAEFVYDGAKVGVLSAQVKNAPPALEGRRRGGGGLWGTRRIRL